MRRGAIAQCVEQEAETLEGEAKEKQLQLIDELNAQQDLVQEKLDELESKDVLKWNEARDAVQTALDKLTKTMESAAK